MKNSKIIDLLKTFSKAEWRDCTNFLAWKYRERGIEWELFKYIKRYREDWENNALILLTINKKIAPKLERKRFLEKRSYLKAKIESFLVSNVQETETYKMEKFRLLGEIYKKRGLYHLYKDLQKPTEKTSKKLKVNDLFTNLKLLEWHHQRYFSEILDLGDKIIFLEQSMEHLEQFYQSLKFYYSTEAKNIHQLYNKEVDISNKENKHHPIDTILSALNKLVTLKEVASFKFLKNDLFNNLDTYSKELQQVIHIYLINTCNYYIRAKDVAYRKEILELYEFGLHTGISLNNGKLSERRFLNMVDVKSKVAAPSESMDFIEEWLKLTNTNASYEKTLKNLAEAIWHFAREDYQEAYSATRILEIKLKDVNISHRVRLIRLCALYSEDNKYAFFKQEIQNARDFYTYAEKKKKLNATIITGSRNLIDILEMLWNGKDYDEVVNFRNNCTYIVHGDWIEKTLEKMAQKK